MVLTSQIARFFDCCYVQKESVEVFKFFAHSYGMFFSTVLKCCFPLFLLASFRVPKNANLESDDVFLSSLVSLELKKM